MWCTVVDSCHQLVLKQIFYAVCGPRYSRVRADELTYFFGGGVLDLRLRTLSSLTHRDTGEAPSGEGGKVKGSNVKIQ